MYNLIVNFLMVKLFKKKKYCVLTIFITQKKSLPLYPKFTFEDP